MNTKLCKKCYLEKPIEDFTREKKGSEKRRSKCRVCTLELDKVWRHSDRGRQSKRKAHVVYLSNPRAKVNYKNYQFKYSKSDNGRNADSKWKKNNFTKMRERSLKIKYNMTLDDYDKLFKNQNEVCDICKNPEGSFDRKGKLRLLAVDHCHKTGKVRGLLCFGCNASLGKFKDSTEILQNAIDYLKKHEG